MSTAYSSLTAYLPQWQGYLPFYLLVLATVSIGNSIQCYLTLSFNRRLYAGPKSAVTPLSARTFATWTTLTSLVRFYAAYNINNAPVYDLAIWTCWVAGIHFCSEIWVFNTATVGEGTKFPLVIFSTTLVWMYSQREFYLSQ